MRTDSLRRDRPSKTWQFDALSPAAKRPLRKAARSKPGVAVPITTEIYAEVDRDWIEVPTSRGVVMVAIRPEFVYSF